MDKKNECVPKLYRTVLIIMNGVKNYLLFVDLRFLHERTCFFTILEPNFQQGHLRNSMPVLVQGKNLKT